MNYKKIVSLFLLLSITTTFLLSCNKYDKNNITKENENVATETTEWTFDKLVQESDCCVLVSRNKSDHDMPSESIYVDGKYHIDVWVSSRKYIDDCQKYLPEKITIIQDEPILDTPTKTGFNIDSFVFLTKTEENNIYCLLTGDGTSVIKTDYYKLKPMDNSLKKDINKKFKNDFNNFQNWLKNEYNFSKIIFENTETQLETTTNPIDIP